MATVVRAERSPHWSPLRNANSKQTCPFSSPGLQAAGGVDLSGQCAAPNASRPCSSLEPRFRLGDVADPAHGRVSKSHVSFIHVSADAHSEEGQTSESEWEGEGECSPLPGTLFGGQRITAMGRAGLNGIPVSKGAQLPSNDDLSHRRKSTLTREPSLMWMEQRLQAKPGPAPGNCGFNPLQSALALPTSLSCQPPLDLHKPSQPLRLLKPSSSPCLTHRSAQDSCERPGHNANAGGTQSNSNLPSSAWMESVTSSVACEEDDLLEDWDPESFLSEGQEFREGWEDSPLEGSPSRNSCAANDVNQRFSFPGHECTSLRSDQRGRGEHELRQLEREAENILMVALEHKLKLIEAQRERSAAHCAKFLLDLEREAQVQQRKEFWGRRTVSAAHTLERRERRAALSRRTVTEKRHNMNVR